MGSFDQEQQSSANSLLADAIRAGIDARLLDMHTMIPGEVVSYDKLVQTCEVAICIKRSINSQEVQLPTLKGVPVNFSRSSNAGTTFILKKGDGVALVFSERNLDKFKTTGAGFIPLDARKFDLSDAVAYPGLFPLKGVMFPPQQDATELRGDKIFIGTAGKIITPIVTTGAGPGVPLGTAVSVAGQLDILQIIEALIDLVGGAYFGIPATGGASDVGGGGGVDAETTAALAGLKSDLGKLKV